MLAKHEYIRTPLQIKKILHCLVLLGLMSITLIASAQNSSPLVHYTIEKGMPSNEVNFIEQDKNGFIWVATNIGLSRFDGYRFKNYTVKDGLPNNQIQKLYVDSKGRNWILSKGTLCYIQEGKVIIPKAIKDQAIEYVTSFLEDDQHHFWYTSGNKVFRMNPDFLAEEIKQEQVVISWNNPEIQFIDQEGYIWIYGGSTFFIKIKEKQVTLVPINKIDNQKGPIKAAFLDGKVYFSNHKGLIELDQQNSRTIPYPFDKKLSLQTNLTERVVPITNSEDQKVKGIASFILQDQQKNIWFAPNGTTPVSYQKQEAILKYYLPQMKSNHGLIDKEGNLWFSTEKNGIFMLPFEWSKMLMEQKERLLTNAPIFTLMQYNNRTIAGSDNYLLVAENNTLTKIGPIDPTKSSNPITSVIAYLDKGILVGTHNELYLYDGTTFYSCGTGGIRDMVLNKDNNLFISTNDNNVFKLSTIALDRRIKAGESGRSLLISDKLVEGIVYNKNIKKLFIENDGRILFGKEDGLFELDQNQNLKLCHQSPVFKSSIAGIAKLNEDNIWIATESDGLLSINDSIDYFNINSSNFNLSHNTCSDIRITENEIWVATKLGVDRIQINDIENRKVNVLPISLNNLIESGKITQILPLDHFVFIGTTAGLIKLDKTAFSTQTEAPPVFITNVKAGNHDYPDRSELVFPHYNKSIQIEYAGLAYSRRGQIQYKYQLEGIDTDWQYGSLASVNYNALPPGRYDFKVYATNHSGSKMSPTPASLKFKIQPHFTNTTWFKAIILGLALVGLFFIYKYIIGYLQRRQLQLEVERKTKQLQEKVAELERTNGELKEFAYVASHDLRSPLRTVNSFLQLLMRRNKDNLNKEGVEYVQFAIKGIKRLERVVDDLLIYAGIGNQTHKPQAIDLNKIVKNVTELLQQSINESKAKVIIEKELPLIMGIKFQMLQLFQNLISNGIKYQFNQALPEITIGYYDEGEFLKFYVKDNGIGIAEEDKDKVFQIFQRLHTPEEYSGTGIGLPICKKILETQGGRIWFTSEQGKGTTFFFTIKNVSIEHPEPATI